MMNMAKTAQVKNKRTVFKYFHKLTLLDIY